jgi:hydrogenase nickel incorporation protein HypA/HybF
VQRPVHELSICRSVLAQALAVAASHDGRAVGRITLRIGPLAGVEPDLLLAAFPIVAAGTPCDGAVIAIEDIAVRVRCRGCGALSVVRPNRLLCAGCGAWQVTLLSGDEMLLASVDLLDTPIPEQKERADV